MNTDAKADKGKYINFNVYRVNVSANRGGTTLKRYSGKVESVSLERAVRTYTVKVRNRQEYFRIKDHQITHVWYAV